MAVSSTIQALPTNATNRRIREIISAVAKESLIPRPDFQRRLVWTNVDKVKFLETILQNLPFPEIYVCAGEVDTETAEGTEWLVDGQQRISTIVSYFQGDASLRLGTTVVPYEKLSEPAKKRFLEYTVVVRDLGSISIVEVREIFQRINSTKYGLNAMELSNARYDGAIKKFAEKLSEDAFYSDHGVFTSADVRRMVDVSFQLSLMITMHSGYFDDTDPHESYLEKYNDEFPFADEYRARISAVFSFINKLELPEKCRWWKKADMFTLLAELDDAMNRKTKTLSPARFAKSLVELEADIGRLAKHDPKLKSGTPRFAAVSKYSYAASQGSSHRKNRLARAELIKELIDAGTISTTRGPKPKLKLKLGKLRK